MTADDAGVEHRHLDAHRKAGRRAENKLVPLTLRRSPHIHLHKRSVALGQNNGNTHPNKPEGNMESRQTRKIKSAALQLRHCCTTEVFTHRKYVCKAQLHGKRVCSLNFSTSLGWVGLEEVHFRGRCTGWKKGQQKNRDWDHHEWPEHVCTVIKGHGSLLQNG